MAAVAGAIAERAARTAVEAGAPEAIVENGGDIFVIARDPVAIALRACDATAAARSPAAVPDLAFRLLPPETPLAICSSSSKMGHSLSFGDCDLATVVAVTGALADAAATRACNSVRSVGDIEPALESVIAIPGVRGAVIVKDGAVGLIGELPELVRNSDRRTGHKTTRREA